MFASRFVSEYSTDRFKTLLRKGGITPIYCRRFYKADNNFCTFKFKIKKDDSDKCFNPEMWPAGINVREWEDISTSARHSNDAKTGNQASENTVNSEYSRGNGEILPSNHE